MYIYIYYIYAELLSIVNGVYTNQEDTTAGHYLQCPFFATDLLDLAIIYTHTLTYIYIDIQYLHFRVLKFTLIPGGA
jgi:hypothetical protein